MNGVHDVGGMQCFGLIDFDHDETPFHEAWEARIFALQFCLRQKGCFTLDDVRDATERLHPVDYLASSYFLRRLRAISLLLSEKAFVTEDELHSTAARIADGRLVVPIANDPSLVMAIEHLVKHGLRKDRHLDSAPLFRAGERITIENVQPRGHTRLPRYARGKQGTIVEHYGAFPVPRGSDSGPHTGASHVYAVALKATDVWGRHADREANIYLSVWEDHLHKIAPKEDQT